MQQPTKKPFPDKESLQSVLRAVADGESENATSQQLIKAETLLSEESHEIRKRGLENTDFAQNIELRRVFACRTFILVSCWMASSMVLIYCIAFNVAKLSDTVLIALITTTLATVVGLLWLVLAYLFPRAPEPR